MPKTAWIDLGNGRHRFIADVDKYLAAQAAPPARSSIAFPMVIRDHIAPTWNPVDGKHYESANGFKRAVKEAGKRAGKEYEIVGDDKAFAEPKPREIKDDPSLKADIKRAYDKASS